MPWILLAGGVGVALYLALKKTPQEQAAEAARAMMEKPTVVAAAPGITQAQKYTAIYGMAMDLLTKAGVFKAPEPTKPTEPTKPPGATTEYKPTFGLSGRRR